MKNKTRERPRVLFFFFNLSPLYIDGTNRINKKQDNETENTPNIRKIRDK